MSTQREETAQALAAEDGKDWDELRPVERDEYRRQADDVERIEAEANGDHGEATNAANTHETGDAAAEVDDKLRGRLDDLILLTGLSRGEGVDELSNDEMLGLGIAYGQPGPIDDRQIEEEAAERLDEYPLCVESTRTFEIVLGTGGPDDRLVFECDLSEYLRPARAVPVPGEQSAPEIEYEIRRVLYRYSWTGSAERVLSGQDQEAAEELARRVVPELGE